MKFTIQSLKIKLERKPKLRQWLWFIFLWLSGLTIMLTLSYGTKAIFLLAPL